MQKSSLFFCICLLTFVVSHCRAQDKKGVATYLLKTELGFINSELDFNDSSSLFICGKTGMDTGVFTHSSMSFDDNDLQKGMTIFTAAYDSIGSLVYRNFKTKEIVIRATKIPPMDAYTIQDNWLPMNWEIDSVFNTVCGLKCQKATGYFRGRYYTAWFAPGIPVPYGPWKLFGLPGLIVMAYDRDNVVYAALTSLCYPCEDLKTSIGKPYEPKNMTIKEAVYYDDHFMKEMEKAANKRLPKGITIIAGKPFRTIKEQRNHAFEKAYEWEGKKPKSSVRIQKQ